MTGPLLKLLRVPPEPEAPDGTPESIQIFRAGRNYYRWRLAMWALSQIGLLVCTMVPLLLLFLSAPKAPPGWLPLWHAVGIAICLWFLSMAIYTYMLQRLNYELRWYIVTDRSLRIRSGIWSVQEITMTFANIQDLRITAGPLQGWLGLADLEVSSAGGGAVHGPGAASHTARFSGIDNAEDVRNLITERLRRYRDAGLGDPHEADHAPANAEAAAAELLAEARALRAAVERA